MHQADSEVERILVVDTEGTTVFYVRSKEAVSYFTVRFCIKKILPPASESDGVSTSMHKI